MADKIFGSDFTDESNPSGTETISINNGTILKDVILKTILSIVPHNQSSKATPVDADEIGLVDSDDSNALKKLTWANLKATAKTYFDTLYRSKTNTTIEGLRLTWNSTTSVTVGIGSCAAQNGDFIDVSSALVKSGLSLSNSTWYHIYVYLSGGVAAAEVVTTAPVAWKGTAYSKTGDTSRRYVGSIKTSGTGTIYNFEHNPATGLIHYQEQADLTPFRVLNNGTATTQTAVDCSGVIPVTSLNGFFKFTNTDGSRFVYWGNSLDSVAGKMFTQGTNAVTFYPMFPLNASQQLTYALTFASTGGGAFCDTAGYFFDR